MYNSNCVEEQNLSKTEISSQSDDKYVENKHKKNIRHNSIVSSELASVKIGLN